MIGHKLITKQTGAGGRPCNAVSSTYFLPLSFLSSCLAIPNIKKGNR